MSSFVTWRSAPSEGADVIAPVVAPSDAKSGSLNTLYEIIKEIRAGTKVIITPAKKSFAPYFVTTSTNPLPALTLDSSRKNASPRSLTSDNFSFETDKLIFPIFPWWQRISPAISDPPPAPS